VKVVLPLKSTLRAGRVFFAFLALFLVWNTICFLELWVGVHQLHRDETGSDSQIISTPTPITTHDLFDERRRVAIRWGVSLMLAAACVGAFAFAERNKSSNRPPSWSRIAMEASPDAIFVTDANLRIVDWNSTAERLLGYQRHELRSQGLECILPITPDMQAGATKFQDAEARMKARVLRQDGTRIPLEITLRYQWLGDRNGFIAFARTQQSAPAVEPAYREEVRFLTQVFESAPSPTVVLDPQGRIERMNRAAEELMHCSSANVRFTCYWQAFLDGEEARKASLEFEDLAATFPPVEQTWRSEHGDQRLFWERKAVREEDGSLRHVVAMARLPFRPANAASQAEITIETDTPAAVSDRKT
jgi:PAS domain S-box-containing protein